ncbi:hypothetical protein [Bacteroides sp.]|uniref:hypothetical protein n=1 Tax=Bacteroides sp. TaxID=29523 RepID=UPI003D10808C
MVLSKKKAYKNLKKKGFVDSPNKSVDHKYLDYLVDGKLILYTKVSHGSEEDLREPLIKQMSTQCKLTKQQFCDLVNCPLSAEKYKQILEEQGEL